MLFWLRLLQAEEEIENLKKVEPLLRKELDTCQEVSPIVSDYDKASHCYMYLQCSTRHCKLVRGIVRLVWVSVSSKTVVWGAVI